MEKNYREKTLECVNETKKLLNLCMSSVRQSHVTVQQTRSLIDESLKWVRERPPIHPGLKLR